MKKKVLVIIDPQNDFMDIQNAALPVIGASADMDRIANLVNEIGDDFYDIQITLDSHHNYHIAHPMFLINSAGENPSPGMQITVKDIKDGVWRARIQQHQNLLLEYVEQLESNGKYVLTVWNPHCLIGSWGHQVYTPLFEALSDWEIRNVAIVGKTTKGSNWSTEHYSAVQADVNRPDDPSTQLNTNFIQTLMDADRVYFAGEASSHCVANTVRDIVDNFGTASLDNLYLIKDAMSAVVIPNVISFQDLADDFFKDMKGKGLHTCTVEEIITGKV